MSAKPKINFYLVHQETGQRYPVGEEVIIGRSNGEIIFSDDPKLSSQHCRLLRTPQGLGLHDLGSSNGTYVDGKKLNPDKIYVFKANSTLTAGQQVFKLQEAKVSKSPARKKRRRKKHQTGLDTASVFAAVLILAAILFCAHLILRQGRSNPNANLKIESPFAMVEKEMKATFNEYAELGRAHAAGQVSDRGLSNGIRKDLLPRMTASYEKLGVLKPAGEFEKRKIEVNRKLILALIDQLTAMAYYAETKSPKYAEDLERFSSVAAAVNEEAQKLDKSRSPSNYEY